MNKKNFRKKALITRNNMSKKECNEKSNKINANIIEIICKKNLKNVMLYVPFKNEVNIITLWDWLIGKEAKIFIPKIDKKNNMYPVEVINREIDLVKSEYGVMEPKNTLFKLDDLSKLDLIIVPGVSYDLNGNRMGLGGGFYDRFLVKLERKVMLVAPAYENQIYSEIPVDKFDQKMNFIVSEKNIYNI